MKEKIEELNAEIIDLKEEISKLKKENETLDIQFGDMKDERDKYFVFLDELSYKLNRII